MKAFVVVWAVGVFGMMIATGGLILGAAGFLKTPTVTIIGFSIAMGAGMLICLPIMVWVTAREVWIVAHGKVRSVARERVNQVSTAENHEKPQ